MAEECSICGATFASAAELVEHVGHDHPAGEANAPVPATEEPSAALRCVFCRARFRSGEALADHLRIQHPSEEPAAAAA